MFLARFRSPAGFEVPWHWPAWPWLLALAAAELVLVYPGVLTPDSAVQLQQARTGLFTDWHPPILPLIWAVLLKLHADPAVMLVLQLALFWAGAALYAYILRKGGHPIAAWMIVAVALFPLFHVYNRMIVKDVALYSALFVASALVFAGWKWRHPWRLWLIVGGASMLCFAALIRANAVFAVAPLLVVCLLKPHGWLQLRVSWLVFAAIALSAVLIPASRFVNQNLLRAQPSDIVQALHLFDLLGIQHHSRDGRIWGDAMPVSQAEADACYTPFYWDTVMQGGVCAPLRQKMGAGPDSIFTPQAAKERQRLWWQAIQSHPWAYLKHRLKHFNSSLYFIVPPRHLPRHLSESGQQVNAQADHQADLRRDYFTRSFLTWPVTWLALACAGLLLLVRRVRVSAEAAFGVVLLLSGLLYALGYLVVGVATEFRYYLWLYLAVMLAGVVAAPELRIGWAASRSVRLLTILLLGAVITVGLASRLLDVPFY